MYPIFKNVFKQSCLEASILEVSTIKTYPIPQL